LGERRHPDQRSQPRGFSIPPHGTSYSMPWNKVFHPMEQNVPPHGTNRKVPPSRVEIKNYTNLFGVFPELCYLCKKYYFYRLNNYYYEEKVHLRRLWIYL
jgi:hypothetical protein